MSVGEQELEREGRRILRQLMAPGARLVRRDDGSYEVAVKGGSPATRRTRISANIAQGFIARKWVDGHAAVLVLTDTGHAWFLRATAHENPFAAQHQVLRQRVVTGPDGGDSEVTVNEAESPIERLHQRGLVDAAQFEAAEKFRRDFTLAQLMPRLSPDLTQPLANSRGGKRIENTLSDTVIMAKQRFNRAMKAVGPGLSDLLYDVCCHLHGLEEAEKAKGWPHRSARVVLTIALERLVAHYGLRVTGRGRMRAWAMEEPGEAAER